MGILRFKPIELEDRAIIEHYLLQKPYHQINCSFDVFYIWRNVGKVSFAVENDLLFIQGQDPDGSCWYFFPFGAGDYVKGIELLWLDYMDHRKNRAELAGFPSADLAKLPCYFRIVGTRKEQFDSIRVQALENEFGIRLIAAEQRDLHEYVYWADHFRGFKGKALQSKRNFVNYARKQYQPTYEPIQPVNLDACKNFVRQFGSADVGFDADTFVQDQGALLTALEDYLHLNLYGGILRIDGQIHALFIGTPLSDYTALGGLFMRVNHAYKGLAPLLYESFLSLHPEFSYINLDSDVGQEGLRKNKLSYLPDHLIEIYELRTHQAHWQHYTSIQELTEVWEQTVGKSKVWQDAALYRISERMGADMHYLVKRVGETLHAVCAFVQTPTGFRPGAWETCDAAHWLASSGGNDQNFRLEVEQVLRAYTDPHAQIEWEEPLPSSYLLLPESEAPQDVSEGIEYYISTLKSKYRNELRKYMEAYRKHGLQWSVTGDYLPLLEAAYPLYLETVSRAVEFQSEAYPKSYFSIAKEELGENAQMLCLRDSEDRLIGFMLLYFKGKTCVMQYTGSRQIKAYYPWHLLTLFSVGYAWTKKIRVIHLGITHFEGKKQFGATASLPSI